MKPTQPLENELTQELKAFEDAYAQLKIAEKNLGDKIGPIIKKAMRRKNKKNALDILVDLVTITPRRFRGVRRIYEAIEIVETQITV